MAWQLWQLVTIVCSIDVMTSDGSYDDLHGFCEIGLPFYDVELEVGPDYYCKVDVASSCDCSETGNCDLWTPFETRELCQQARRLAMDEWPAIFTPDDIVYNTSDPEADGEFRSLSLACLPVNHRHDLWIEKPHRIRRSFGP